MTPARERHPRTDPPRERFRGGAPLRRPAADGGRRAERLLAVALPPPLRRAHRRDPGHLRLETPAVRDLPAARRDPAAAGRHRARLWFRIAGHLPPRLHPPRGPLTRPIPAPR